MICEKLYRTEGINFPIAENSLRLLLQACTQEVPFYAPDGNMYTQTDGVAMGSPLGVLFANFYMGTLEERIFSLHPELKPPIYTRYIDDVFISAKTTEDLLKLKAAFKNHSSLNFTHETEKEQKLPFLDVLVRRNTSNFSTQVYVKETNLGFCLNAASECPDRYRRSVINSFVKRAFTHCSSWESTTAELQRISQLLTNNGYKKSEIDDVIRRRMNIFMDDQKTTENNKNEQEKEVRIFYKNYMSSSHKEDEKAIKRIISNNVKTTDEDAKLKLVIYYKTKSTASLVIKNNCLPAISNMQETNLIYQYSCNVGDCSRLNSRYIGSTITTLSKRITAHLQDGAIKRHHLDQHGTAPTRKHLEESTEVLQKEPDRKRIRMAEQVFIHMLKPSINIQLLPGSRLPTHRQSQLSTSQLHPHEGAALSLSRPHPRMKSSSSAYYHHFS